MKIKRTFDLPERLRQLHRAFYPLPEALVGYLFGILFAALSMGAQPIAYAPLPMKDALADALAAELPFFLAAALLAFIRPTALAGGALIFLRAACCGYGAELLLPSTYPSLDYFRYVVTTLLGIALCACLTRQAVELFLARGCADRRVVGDYLVRWLFYSGIALLLLPLRYFVGF